MKNKLALLTCAVSAALAFQASATTDRDYDNRWIDLKYVRWCNISGTC
ncbi:hypothetical protein [Pseudoalteromonas sp. MMG012]|nr:hypothetical protein [Pseudoalteromonas sp. MMG012]MBQ4852443.1 hypothetical protein [Pseudoalteromonas sp. MMG012]